MSKYYVFTPEYTTYKIMTALDPPECGCDVVDVEATTKRKALILGLKALEQIRSEWIRDERGDGRNPFSKLKVQKACECDPPGNDENNCTGDCYPED